MILPDDAGVVGRPAHGPSRRKLRRERRTCGNCGAWLRMSYPRSGIAVFCPDCEVLVRSE